MANTNFDSVINGSLDIFNLIIKGNNLLALASLKKEFAGKVKLIYIDPPYNTGNDGFKYNDSFNHSSWLVFMKNRLEIAKQLLRNDGLIFVQTDYNEAHYLKILLDEIFGREKFVNEIIWKRKFGTANETRRFATAFDNIYLYSKTENYTINLIREKDTKHVQEYIKARFTRKDSIGPHAGRFWMPYPLANPGKPTKNLIYEYKGYSAPSKGWRMTKETLEKFDKEGRLYFPEDKKQRIQEKKFLDEYAGQPVDALWTDIFVINSQSDEALEFDGQKPEDLLRRIILIGSNENDIVLDYHAGTGTTLAVAHKTGRQYIGIEQMDYIHELPEARLKKVIAGEQGGISKAVKWKGGGDFVYTELVEWNEKWVKKIRKAKTGKDLEKLWDGMKETAFLSYKVEPKTIDTNIKDFVDLSIADQKKFLIECLDKNQLYINLSEIEDKEYGVSKEDQKLNKEFYGK
jgi:adenine-specific DNA-methyltransferase